MEGGPGLPVLNSLAARQLAELGFRSVTLSMEADRRKLQDLTAQCPVACSLTVFGRPPLWISRVKLPDESFHETVLQDRRRVRIQGRQEHGLWVFRPIEPFDLRDVHNERIQVAHLVVDLVGSKDPVALPSVFKNISSQGDSYSTAFLIANMGDQTATVEIEYFPVVGTVGYSMPGCIIPRTP